MKVHLYAGDAQESPTTYCGKEPDSVRIHGVYTREAMEGAASGPMHPLLPPLARPRRRLGMTTTYTNDLVIFDLDGTLANADHRQYLIERTPKDWDAYFACLCPKDAPNWPADPHLLGS